ncbi:MAG: hypothetical protein Q8T08_12885, partial [Ignavibacteria bacterium]|nr:hypothetical protein [Ignavibacteria bacterium]
MNATYTKHVPCINLCIKLTFWLYVASPNDKKTSCKQIQRKFAATFSWNNMNAKEELLNLFSQSLEKANFIKLIISKPLQKSADLKRVSLKMVELKAGRKVSFTYNYQSRDEVKNFSSTQSSEIVSELLENHFLEANLFTIDSHYMLLTNKKAVGKIIHNQLNSSAVSDLQHDKQKKRLLDATQPHWFLLGLTDQKGNILPSMQHKFKQVNKYIEILDGLIPSKDEKKEIHIAD